MAGELRHKDVSTELSRTEWEATDTHYVVTGTTNDTLRIDSNDNLVQSGYLFNTGSALGVGTATIDTNLHVEESNTDTTPALQIEQGSTGDAALSFLLTGGEQFSIGIDNSDSDKFKISDNSALGTNDRLVIDSSGNVGIGTASPAQDLHIQDATAIERIESTGVDSQAVLQLKNDARQWSAKINTDDTFQIRDDTAAADRVTIDTSGNVGIGTTTIPHGSIGAAKLAIEGTDSSAAGPHIQATTPSDNYPLLQILNFRHDNVGLNFDAYWDSGWESSDAGSNFQIYKITDQLQFNYASGIAQGSAITWNNGIVMDTSGQVGIGTASPGATLENTGSFIPGSTSTPAQLTASVNDWALSSTAYFFRADADSPWNVTGIASGTAGRKICIGNIGVNAISFTNEDAASTAANRILNPASGTLTLGSGEFCEFWYDGTSSRWRSIVGA